MATGCLQLGHVCYSPRTAPGLSLTVPPAHCMHTSHPGTVFCPHPPLLSSGVAPTQAKCVGLCYWQRETKAMIPKKIIGSIKLKLQTLWSRVILLAPLAFPCLDPSIVLASTFCSFNHVRCWTSTSLWWPQLLFLLLGCSVPSLAPALSTSNSLSWLSTDPWGWLLPCPSDRRIPSLCHVLTLASVPQPCFCWSSGCDCPCSDRPLLPQISSVCLPCTSYCKSKQSKTNLG